MATIYQSISENINVAGNTAEDRHIPVPFEGKWFVEEVRFAPSSALAIDGTNYATGTISTNDGAGGSFVAIGSHTTNTGGTALVVGTTVNVSLLSTAAAMAAREVEQGHQIKIAKTVGGSGGAIDGQYSILLRRIG